MAHATRVPVGKSTSEAVFTIVPAPSFPSSTGVSGALYRPVRKYTSIKLTPAASTFTSACPGFNSGSGTSLYFRFSGPPTGSATIAFIRCDCTVRGDGWWATDHSDGETEPGSVSDLLAMRVLILGSLTFSGS